MRPNLLDGHYWHSNYWDPLYSLHEELDVTWGFHEGTGAWNSHMHTLHGENRFHRHVASHWIEMQQALVAMMVGGIFEFQPKLRVGFLEARNSWVPGLLSRIEWDDSQYRDTHAPYLTLTPREYFQRNCWLRSKAARPRSRRLRDSSTRIACALRVTIRTSIPISPTCRTICSEAARATRRRRSSWVVRICAASPRPISRKPTRRRVDAELLNGDEAGKVRATTLGA